MSARAYEPRRPLALLPTTLSLQTAGTPPGLYSRKLRAQRQGRACCSPRPVTRVPPLHQSSQLWPSKRQRVLFPSPPPLRHPYPPNCWNTTGPVQPYAARAAHAVRHDPSPRVPPPLRHSLLNWPVKASGKGMLFPSPPPPRTRSLLTTLSLPTAGTPPGLYSSKRARGRQVLLPSPLPLTTSLPSNRGNASPRPLYMYHTSPAPFNRGNATQRARAPNAAAGILVPSPPPLTPRSPSQPACTDPLTPTAAGTHAARLCPLRVLFSRVPNAEGVAV